MNNPDKTLSISLDPEISKLWNAPKMQSQIRQELRIAMKTSTAILRADVVNNTPMFLGFLRNSILEETTVTPTGIIGVVVTANPYALPVEEGSRPHFPPLEPIILWVRRKLAGKGSMMQAEARDEARIQRRDVANALQRGRFAGRHALSAKANLERAIRSRAFLIARAISRRGTRGHWMFLKAYENKRQTVLRIFEEAADRIMLKFGKK